MKHVVFVLMIAAMGLLSACSGEDSADASFDDLLAVLAAPPAERVANVRTPPDASVRPERARNAELATMAAWTTDRAVPATRELIDQTLAKTLRAGTEQIDRAATTLDMRALKAQAKESRMRRSVDLIMSRAPDARTAAAPAPSRAMFDWRERRWVGVSDFAVLTRPIEARVDQAEALLGTAIERGRSIDVSTVRPVAPPAVPVDQPVRQRRKVKRRNADAAPIPPVGGTLDRDEAREDFEQILEGIRRVEERIPDLEDVIRTLSIRTN